MILKKSVLATEAYQAADRTEIREVLHPKNEAVDLPYSLAHASLAPGRASEPHILLTSSEVYIFVRGNGRVNLNGKWSPVGPGDVIHIPAGVQQHVENQGDESLEFWCIVAPPWSAQDEMVG